MRKTLKLSALLLLAALTLPSATRINREYTVVAGTAINIYTGRTGAAGAANDAVYADRVFIQMSPGGTGVGYVMDNVPRGVAGSSSNSAHLTAYLAPATASAPGGSYSDSSGASGIDVTLIWIDGAANGDKIKVSYVPRSF